MLHREIMAVCFKVHTKLWAERRTAELLNAETVAALSKN